MIHLDLETCGFHGVPVLLQYAIGDGDVQLHDLWLEPVDETLMVMDSVIQDPTGVNTFNGVFDWFHFQKYYNMLQLAMERLGGYIYPADHIDEMAIIEKDAIDGPCVKPYGFFDTMLHARKGPYQTLMDRKDISIKKVPTPIAYLLAEELGQRIPLKDVYFARFRDPTRRWQVYPWKDPITGIADDNFKNVVLKFAPSSALKALAVDTGVREAGTRYLYADIEISPTLRPVETGWAPFALAPIADKKGKMFYPRPGKWLGKWPAVIEHHINHWRYNTPARTYAADDVIDLRNLYHFFGDPPINDNDSLLAAQVASSRWHGFSIDVDAIKAQQACNDAKIADYSTRFNANKSSDCMRYLAAVMDPTEQLVISASTRKIILETISKWKLSDVCSGCEGLGCSLCQETGLAPSDKLHPAAERAIEILSARGTKKENELFTKILMAGRLHASFKIIGAKSSRMSGADGLNPQGIKRAKSVRACFTLASPPMQLDGGDYDGQEVTVADAVYYDSAIHAIIVSGQKIHAYFGSHYFFPNMTPEMIMACKGLEGEADKYTRSKNCVFAIYYFGTEHTLHTRGGLSKEVALNAYNSILRDFPELNAKRSQIIRRFCTLSQTRGIGSKIEYTEPDDYMESVFGFRRYFTLENQVVKCLVELAEDLPKSWQGIDIKVMRRDRVQTACGATRSALYGAGFAIQAAVMRAAGNHAIQSPGADLSKGLQVTVWNFQPCGVHPWKVQPLNAHDEVLACVSPEISDDLHKAVDEYNERQRSVVPLLKMDWKQGMKSWAEK